MDGSETRGRDRGEVVPLDWPEVRGARTEEGEGPSDRNSGHGETAKSNGRVSSVVLPPRLDDPSRGSSARLSKTPKYYGVNV